MRPNVVTEGFSSILFHASLLHVFFNMVALVPLGSELERLMGSVRFLYIILLLTMSNAILHLLAALLITQSFSLLAIDARVYHWLLWSFVLVDRDRDKSKWSPIKKCFWTFQCPRIHVRWMYVWILLLVFQVLMSNVSFLGHLCGILSGFAYTYGFNFLIPGPSFFSAIEASPLLLP